MARSFDVSSTDKVSGTITAVNTGPFTVGAWINPTAGQNLGRFVGAFNDGVGQCLYMLADTQINLIVGMSTTNMQRATSTASIGTGVWMAVVGVYGDSLTASNSFIYVGTRALAMSDLGTPGNTNGSGTRTTGHATGVIGNRIASDRSFRGVVAQAFMVPWAMTLDEAEAFRLGDWTVLLAHGAPRFFQPLTDAQLNDVGGGTGLWTMSGSATVADGPPFTGSWSRGVVPVLAVSAAAGTNISATAVAMVGTIPAPDVTGATLAINPSPVAATFTIPTPAVSVPSPAPVIENKTAITDGTSVFTKPTGLADGDIVYILFWAFQAGTLADGTNVPQAPSGFTTLYADTTTGSQPTVCAFRKVITSASGEPGTYTVGDPAVTGTGNGYYQGGIIYRVSGADTTTPEDDFGSADGNAGTATTGAIIDSSTADALLLVNAASGGHTFADPSGMTLDATMDGGDSAAWSQTITSQLVSATRSSVMSASGVYVIGFVVVKPPSAGGTNATPTVVAATFVIPTPAITGSASVAVTVVAQTWTIPTPALTVTTTAAPTVVAATFTVPTPAISRTTTPTPTVAAATFVIPTPAVSAALNLTATAVAATFTVPTPTLSLGANVAATVAAQTWTIPTPAVSTSSAANATPIAVAATFTIPTPTITATANVATTAVAQAWVIPSPSVVTGSNVAIGATDVEATFTIPTPAIAGTQIAATAATATFVIPTPTVGTPTNVTVTRVQIVAVVGTSPPTTAANVTPTAVAATFVPRTPTRTASATIQVTTVAGVMAIATPGIGGAVSLFGGNATSSTSTQGAVMSMSRQGASMTFTKANRATQEMQPL